MMVYMKHQGLLVSGVGLRIGIFLRIGGLHQGQ